MCNYLISESTNDVELLKGICSYDVWETLRNPILATAESLDICVTETNDICHGHFRELSLNGRDYLIFYRLTNKDKFNPEDFSIISELYNSSVEVSLEEFERIAKMGVPIIVVKNILISTIRDLIKLNKYDRVVDCFEYDNESNILSIKELYKSDDFEIPLDSYYSIVLNGKEYHTAFNKKYLRSINIGALKYAIKKLKENCKEISKETHISKLDEIPFINLKTVLDFLTLEQEIKKITNNK